MQVVWKKPKLHPNYLIVRKSWALFHRIFLISHLKSKTPKFSIYQNRPRRPLLSKTTAITISNGLNKPDKSHNQVNLWTWDGKNWEFINASGNRHVGPRHKRRILFGSYHGWAFFLEYLWKKWLRQGFWGEEICLNAMWKYAGHVELLL